MDGGAWWAAVCEAAKSPTWLSDPATAAVRVQVVVTLQAAQGSVVTSSLKTLYCWDFPSGPVVRVHPPYDAGDVGSVPGQQSKIPRSSGLLSPRATAREPSWHAS